MHKSSWDNLRFVLAVADHGSISSAARALGVNHATVLRRVAAFERDNGGMVFDKKPTGYRVMPDRANVIEAAREVASAIGSVEQLMHGSLAPLSGQVRVSSTDSFCQIILPPLIARLHSRAPGLTIELLSSNSHLDFARMQADISVRPAKRLPDEMAGDTSAELGFAVYRAPGGEEAWLGLSGPLARSVPAAWQRNNVDPELIVAGADSFLVLREMAAAGSGYAILPIFVGDQSPGLERCTGLMPEIAVPVWVATYVELSGVQRIRAVRDHILTYLAEKKEVLNGARDIAI